MRLFCFPYAGGSASIYGAWANHLPAHVEICPVQLPGRENRLKEMPYKRFTVLIKALADALLPVLDKPFAFFGHSMGAFISFELARYLRERALPQPIHLFVSGARAPQISNPQAPIHHLPDKTFAAALKDFNGTAVEILENEEFMKILMPYLRADFELYETYAYQHGVPFSLPISVFGGWQDGHVTSDQLGAWRDHTSNTCVVHMFSGDHFFLHTSREQVLRVLSHELASL